MRTTAHGPRRMKWPAGMFIVLSLTLAFVARIQAQTQQGRPPPSTLLVDGGIQVRDWVPPVYPADLKAEKIQGDVTVHIVVDAAGALKNVRAARSSDPRFEAAAVESVSKWTFEPAVEDSKRVTAAASIRLFFKLPEKTPSQHPPEISWPQPLPKTPATAEFSPQPEYPDALLPRQINGEVLIDFAVDEKGVVSETALRGTTNPDFVLPALQAVRRWTFRPAMQGDLAVPDVKRFPVKFFVYTPKFEAGMVTQLQANGFALRPPEGQSGSDLCERPPEIWEPVDPVYPHAQALAGEAGEVVLEFTVDFQGNTENVQVVSATGPEFGKAAEKALTLTKFKAAMKAGRTVPVPMTWTCRFTPPPETAPEIETGDARLIRLARAGQTVGGPKGLDGKLQPLWRVSPTLSETLREVTKGGKADIEFIVDRDGRARLPRIVSATHEDLGWAAATAVKQWVFEIPTRGGVPVDVRVRIPFTF
jgi:TonB family protein